MAESIALSGSCLCKSVKVETSVAGGNVGACHCSSCRKWGGGPMLTIDCGTGVRITNDHDVAVFSSSEWAERGFCKQCGTHLFYRLKGNQQYIMPIGLFDETAALNFDHQIFIDEKPHYYDFSNETKNMTGPEVFAQYAPDSNDA